MRRKNIAIVGAGPAGLSAAYALKKNNFHVEVFEAEKVPGGRVQSISCENGIVIDRGASFITEAYRNTFKLIKMLGIENQLVAIAPHVRCEIQKDHHLEVVDFGSPLALVKNHLIPRRQSLKAYKLFPALIRARMNCPDFSTLLGLDPFDNESMETWLTRTMGEETLRYHFSPFCELMWGWHPGQISKAFGILLALQGHQKIWTFRNGMGTLTQILAQNISLRCNMMVKGIYQTNEKVVLEMFSEAKVSEKIHADAVILAIPGSAVLDIWKNPPEHEHAFLSQVNYVPNVVAHIFCTQEPPITAYSRLFTKDSKSHLAGITMEHKCRTNQLPQGQSLLYVSPSSNHQKILLTKSESEVAEFFVSELEKVFPGIRNSVRKIHIFRWRHATPTVHVGAVRALSKYRQIRKSERIILAGDYLGSPTIEGAISSGLQAAKNIEIFFAGNER